MHYNKQNRYDICIDRAKTYVLTGQITVYKQAHKCNVLFFNIIHFIYEIIILFKFYPSPDE
jgi:hypothetical protein